MRKITQKILLFTSVFALMFAGGVVLAEDANDDLDTQERVDLLLEKTEELLDLIVEMKEAGELPLTPEVTKTDEVECELYLTEYITYGVGNNPQEVEKLQVFLNDHMGENIPVTGFYGEITMGVVNDFQVKYTEEILSPWGTTRPTGQVYKTTQRKINDIMCPEVAITMPDISVDLERIEEEVAEETEEEEEMVFLEDTFFPLDEDENEYEDEDEENGNDLITGFLNRGNGTTNYLPILIIIVGLVGIAAILYYIYSPKKQNKGKLIS